MGLNDPAAPLQPLTACRFQIGGLSKKLESPNGFLKFLDETGNFLQQET